ncbi:Tm-1-like ATP-binding domain-containing protein [Kribbella sp. NPDC048928]|uniref:Tm-1-like ATP-binding domain-containing protein n=1 Tax=Kribbella sp. NPDC048928 TaxID=3364111 RepID=UPI00371925FA
MPTIALVGALDTKGAEYAYLADQVSALGAAPLLVDIGVLDEPTVTADIPRERIAGAGFRDAVGGRSNSALDELRREHDRNAAMRVMARGAGAVLAELVAARRVDGVLAVGGSNAAYVMAEICGRLPFGFPKVLVSTIAAGDTRAYVRETDLTLMYPVVDINGLNRLSRPVLGNAARAVVGMAGRTEQELACSVPTVGVSMFGVTTAAGSAVVQGLSTYGVEALTFHCTGVGGRTLESLIRNGTIEAVADLTTTELADELVGGVCSAGPGRLTAAASTGVPQVVSVGALDMVNFSGTVPTEFADRRLHPHNPAVTLMRTTPDECTELGRRMAARLNPSTAPVAVLFPHCGLSQLSVPGAAFHDPDADQALYRALKDGLRPGIDLYDFDTDINDPVVSGTAVELLATWLKKETP